MCLVNPYHMIHCSMPTWYNCPQICTTLVCPEHVLTPMFKTITFPKFSLFRFLCPSIPPVALMKRIIAALDDQHSQMIFLPFYTHLIPFIGHLPSFLQDLVEWVCHLFQLSWSILNDYPKVSGANYVMQKFVKISGQHPDEGSLPSEINTKEWTVLSCIIRKMADTYICRLHRPTVRGKTFKSFLKLNYFLNNSRATEQNKFKFGIVVEYHVINKFQFVLLHNINFFPCY